MKKKQFWLVMLLSLVALFGCKKDEEVDDNEKEPAQEVESGEVKFGNITINVPEGALESSVSMTAKQLSASSYDDCVAAVEFGPDGTNFLKPVTVTMPLEKTPEDGMVVVFYNNKAENKLVAVDVAEVSGSMVTFHVNHYSAYILCLMNRSDYEATTQSIRNDVKAGQSISYVGQKYFDYIVKTDNYYNRWTMIDGRLYKPSRLSMLIGYDYNGDSHQALYYLGEKDLEDNALQRRNGSDFMFSFDSSDAIFMLESEGKSMSEFSNELDEVYNVAIDREYSLVAPEMEYEQNGKLEKQGDECELTIRLYSEHSGETYNTKSYWNVDGEFGNGDNIQLVDEYPTQEGEMPWIYQTIKLRSTDPSIELSETTVTTDENGVAKVKVKAVKDEIEGKVEIVYEYNDDYDEVKVEKSVSFENGAMWDVSINCEVKIQSVVGIDIMYTYTMHIAFPDQAIIAGSYDAQMSLDHPVLYTPDLEFSGIDNSTGNKWFEQYVFNVGGDATIDRSLYVISDINNPGYVKIPMSSFNWLFFSWEETSWTISSENASVYNDKHYLPVGDEIYIKLSEGMEELPLVEKISGTSNEFSVDTNFLTQDVYFWTGDGYHGMEPTQYKCTATIKKTK